MGLGDSSPRRCNRVRPDTGLLGVVSVTNPVSVHLKQFDHRRVRVLKPVVDLEVGAEGSPLFVEVGGTSVGNVTSPDCRLRRAEITDETTAFGGWQTVQKEGDCSGWYLLENRERKAGLGK